MISYMNSVLHILAAGVRKTRDHREWTGGKPAECASSALVGLGKGWHTSPIHA
jgi:hypothetical protein